MQPPEQAHHVLDLFQRDRRIDRHEASAAEIVEQQDESGTVAGRAAAEGVGREDRNVGADVAVEVDLGPAEAHQSVEEPSTRVGR